MSGFVRQIISSCASHIYISEQGRDCTILFLVVCVSLFLCLKYGFVLFVCSDIKASSSPSSSSSSYFSIIHLCRFDAIHDLFIFIFNFVSRCGKCTQMHFSFIGRAKLCNKLVLHQNVSQTKLRPRTTGT